MAVDYACWRMLWISGGRRKWGSLRPHAGSPARSAHWPPATKSELRERTGLCGEATLSCTLHILADVLTGAHGSGVVLENACCRRDTLLNSCGVVD